MEDVTPQAVCVHVSTNDISRNTDLEKIVAEMENLIVLIKDQGIQPIVSLVIPRNDKHGYKVKLINEMLMSISVRILDWQDNCQF